MRWGKVAGFGRLLALLALTANAQTADPPTSPQSVTPDQVFGEWQGLSRACERMSLAITAKGLKQPWL